MLTLVLRNKNSSIIFVPNGFVGLTVCNWDIVIIVWWSLRCCCNLYYHTNPNNNRGVNSCAPEGFYDLGIRTSWQYAIKATEDINFSGLFVKLSVFVEFRVFRTFVHVNTFVFSLIRFFAILFIFRFTLTISCNIPQFKGTGKCEKWLIVFTTKLFFYFAILCLYFPS
jgi:hypothetical protein